MTKKGVSKIAVLSLFSNFKCSLLEDNLKIDWEIAIIETSHSDKNVALTIVLAFHCTLYLSLEA